MNIIGRKKEAGKLDTFFNSNKSEFMAIYGRRRVGKTFLVNTYFKDKACVFFSATGMDDCSFEDQRTAFCSELSRYFFQGVMLEIPKTWFKVFEILDKAIDNTSGKFVIFLDEFPWMATPKSKLLHTVEYFWNQRWSSSGRIKLILCGSLSSWIIRNIIDNTGGLYHRATHRLLVEPFNLHQTQEFLKKNNQVNLTHNQITRLYTVMGGIPLYLEQVVRGESANQIIDRVCFSKNGLLFDEMDALFRSLFSDSGLYMEITKNIAKHHYGIGKQALSKKVKIQRGGRFNSRLKELEEAGFIQSFLPYKHKEKGVYYRISDEYTMFYFHWIKPDIRKIRKLVESSGYWLARSKEGRFHAWRGYAFEAICYKSIPQILRALKLSPASAPNSWRHRSNPDSMEESGTQIDLLFERDDDAITICEIKYTEKPFVIDRKYAEILRGKLNVFRSVTKTTKQLFLVIISANGIKENKHSMGLVESVVTLEDLFTEI